MGVYQTPGSNAKEIIENIHAQLDVLEKDFPPGMSVTVNFDTNEFLTASIEKVVVTLLEAFILVFIVVRSEEHTSELQSLMRISYAVFCLTKNNKTNTHRSI